MRLRCHSWIPEYKELALASGLAQMAAEVISSRRICFFEDGYFINQPGSVVPAPWHHDVTYYEIEGEILVAWVPLDPHGEYETLRMVAGSHRWGTKFLRINFASRRVPLAIDPMTRAGASASVETPSKEQWGCRSAC